ncbi:hypothetical protein CH379_002610 [Leptospira ellisii]|uniref:Lipoprotein n=1 Tax=Leptospira ellisii TaxID=2023197 RepID=A0A2N0BP99_9LEPT|nr:hypothetical protein [Leptospira ellisii]MDV6234517.1 hypothetical protein [Leptospira ellisii]PJZ92659.1 hypothetical protein CH379_11985 [Leptospira ellisii]PKA05820.1 hypothetical protein CH375_02975 [Leptospira ellisii]
MKTVEKKFRYVLTLALVAFVLNLTNCAEDKKDDFLPLALVLALTGSSAAADLIQPVDGTAIYKLGESTQILASQNVCAEDFISVSILPFTNPNLDIHNLSFADANLNPTLMAVGGATNVSLVIDEVNGQYAPGTNNTPGSCQATIKENSATIFDIQVLNCPVTRTNAGDNIPDTTLSFRIRCTK